MPHRPNQSMQRSFRDRFALRIQFFVATIWVLLTATLLGRFHWILDLTSHFVVQYCFLSLLLCGIASWLRPRWTVFAAGLASVMTLIWILPAYSWSERAKGGEGEPLRVMSCNVLTSNLDHVKFKGLVEKESPNVILMMEIDANWEEHGIRSIQSSYPHQHVLAREDNFGIALLSDRPLMDVQFHEFDERVPSVIAKVEIGGATIQLIGTHPLPPMNHTMWSKRNQQFDAIAQFILEKNTPTIVFGDLNCTPWSWYFGRFLQKTSLVDSRLGFGVQPSWPTDLILSPARIPIDHVLHSKELVVSDRRLGTDIGSDHLPVIVDFVVNHERVAKRSSGTR